MGIYDYHDNNAAITISKVAFLGYLGKRTSLDRTLADDGAYVTGDATKVEDVRKLVSFEKRSYTRKGAAMEEQEPINVANAEVVKKTTKKAVPKTKTARKPRTTKNAQK